MLVIVTSIVSIRQYGSIFGARIEDQSHANQGTSIRVKASTAVMHGQPVVGDLWDVEGRLVDTPKWGLQIDAIKATRKLPTGKLITAFLSGHAPGVGPERAGALWKHYGVGLKTVLSDEANIPAIAAVIAPDRKNLAPQLAAACVRTWKAAQAEARTLVWLDAHGIEDVSIAGRVCQILGDAAIEKLSANPYCLVPLLKWAKVDALALKLLSESCVAEPTRDVRRLVGACDAVVKAHIKAGHTAGTLETLSGGLVDCLNVPENSPVIGAAIEAGKKHGAILLVADDQWRAPGCAAMEDLVQARLREIGTSKSSVKIPRRKAIEQLLLDARVGALLPLHPEQREAALKVVLSPLACLQGGAGVGKTSTAKAICDLWEQFGGNLVLTAVAGKAALRLSRSTGRLAMTLARLRNQLEQRESIERELDGNLTASERKRAAAKLAMLAQITECSLVLVDEASMLDLANANALLRFMPAGARLVLVGDEAQLPPVGFGLIYHRLVNDEAITARLTVIHRQTEATGIPMVAAAIRRGIMPELRSYSGPGEGVSFIEHTGPDLQSKVKQVWEQIRSVGVAPLIVTATNGGDAGVHALNALLHSAWHQDRSLEEMKGHFGQWFSAGEPVVCLKNDYSLGLFNGLLGEVIRIEPDGGTLLARFDGYDEPHRLGDLDLLDLQLAYAISCHRAQGSQAPVVIVPIYSARLLDPSWLYTAITRAERQVVLIGSKVVLAEALAQPRAADRRMVGFQWAMPF